MSPSPSFPSPWIYKPLNPLIFICSDRFLFILLGPPGKTKSYNEIGRAIATLMVDDVSDCHHHTLVDHTLFHTQFQICWFDFISFFNSSCSAMLPTKQGTVKTWLQVLMSFWMRWLYSLQVNGIQKYASNLPKRFHRLKWGTYINIQYIRCISKVPFKQR